MAAKRTWGKARSCLLLRLYLIPTSGDRATFGTLIFLLSSHSTFVNGQHLSYSLTGPKMEVDSLSSSIQEPHQSDAEDRETPEQN